MARAAAQVAWTHPRLHGEYAQRMSADTIPTDSPPLTRGMRSSAVAVEKSLGLTPAGAGNTLELAASAGLL